MSKEPKRTDFSSICRTCMSTKSLVPIFDGKASINYYSTVIFIVSGVKVEKEDGLPQKICTICIKQIKNTIEFRKRSQSIETMLLKVKNSKIIKTDESDTNIIENNPVDDLSDDEKLINYVNKNKKQKSQRKLNKFNIKTSHNNLNKNYSIKKEAKTDINKIITEKDDINIENNVKFKQISTQNSIQNDVIPVKEEIDDITNNRRSYNYNETRTKHNNTGCHDNNAGFIHNDIKTNTNNSTCDHNESGIHNEARNNHNSTETSHNDSGYNFNDTGININNPVYDHNKSETHNEVIDNHISAVTSNNDSGRSHNNTGTNLINSLYNYNESETHNSACDHKESEIHNEARNIHNSTETNPNDSEYNHNSTGTFTNNYKNKSETHNDENYSTETSHNDSGYNHNEKGPNNHNEKTHNHNENNTTAITITEAVKNNRVSCKICYKDLSFRSLDVHMSKCHPDLDDRKSKCDLCSSYVTKNRMKRHVALHGDRFLCVFCMKEHNDIETLKLHTESCVQRIKKRSDNHTAKELMECDVCNKVMQKGSLRLHKRLKHAGLGPVCEHCGKKLSNKLRLSEHLRAKHGYEKHKCSLCDFQTAFRVHLKVNKYCKTIHTAPSSSKLSRTTNVVTAARSPTSARRVAPSTTPRTSSYSIGILTMRIKISSASNALQVSKRPSIYPYTRTRHTAPCQCVVVYAPGTSGVGIIYSNI